MNNNSFEDLDFSLKISRYTSLRYLTSFIFFMSLYRAVTCLLNNKFYEMIIPVFQILSMIIISINIVLIIYNNKQSSMKNTVNILKVNILTFSSYMLTLLIIKKNSMASLNDLKFKILFLFFDLSILIISSIKANKIINNDDRVYKKYIKINNKIKGNERIKYV